MNSNPTNEEIEADRHEAIRNYGNVAFAPTQPSPEAIAQGAIQRFVEELAAKYPSAGLTFGYIGNIWNSPSYCDDRCWYVFTKIQVQGLWGMQNAKFGAFATKDLVLFAQQVKNDLENWIARTARY